jgi:hypothetical protein
MIREMEGIRSDEERCFGNPCSSVLYVGQRLVSATITICNGR